MYSRKLGETTLTFGHEGILYKRSFLMYDHQTKSLWVHTTGQAIRGKFKGKLLEFLPSRVTSWKEWKTAHPKTRVLTGAKARGFMGSYRARQRPGDYGLSLGSGKKTKLYRFADLAREPLLADTFGGREILVAFDVRRAVAAVFEPEGRSFRLREPGRMIMADEKGSDWNALTGLCVAGPEKGKSLKRVPATAWLLHRWKGFYPEGDIYKPKG